MTPRLTDYPDAHSWLVVDLSIIELIGSSLLYANAHQPPKRGERRCEDSGQSMAVLLWCPRDYLVLCDDEAWKDAWTMLPPT